MNRMRMIAVFLIATFLTITLVFAGGCGGNGGPSQEVVPMPTFTPENYPVVDGSTVTIPLSEALGARLMGIPVEEARQYILHNKTHQAYVNLIGGSADLIFVTSPSEEELALAAENQVELELIPVVSEGFVFLTSQDNPVTDLSLEEIQGIYTGRITNWQEVGGQEVGGQDAGSQDSGSQDAPIVAYQRPVNSGSQTGFLELVMKGLTPQEPPMEQVIAEMGALIDAVATYKNQPNAIGYSYYYFVTDMWGNEKVKLLSVDGVYPDKKTIQDGTYPIRTGYYAVMRKSEAPDSPSRQIVAWLLSGEGQQMAEEAGYVKVQ